MKRYSNRIGACDGGPCDHIEDDPHGDIVYLSDIAPLLEQCEVALLNCVAEIGRLADGFNHEVWPAVEDAREALAALRSAKGGG